MLPMLAMMAPGAIQSGFGLAGLLKKRKKFEGTSRGRMLGRQAGEGQFSSQQEREMQNRLFESLIRFAGEETDEIKRAAFPVLEKSKLAGARLLSAPYRDVRAKMTDAELRLQAGERRASMEAGQQFGAEREQFETQEDARRSAATQQLAGGLTSMGAAAGAKAMGLLEGDWKDYAAMSLLGMRPPAYFRPKQATVPGPNYGELTGILPGNRKNVYEWADKFGVDRSEAETLWYNLRAESGKEQTGQDSIFGNYLRKTGNI